MKTFLSDKVYDILKWVAQYILPGVATLYFGLSQFWSFFPFPERIVGTIVAVDVFLGAILGLSTIQYNNNKRFEEATFSDLHEENSPVLIPIGLFGMSPKTYDILKWATLICLPATGALYFALSRIWLFPYGTEIVGTIALITTFAGLFLGKSTVKFEDANK